jgi:hypothetical protein
MGGILWAVCSPFPFRKIEGWFNPHIQPLLLAQPWMVPSVPAHNTCPSPHSWPDRMDGTMLDTGTFNTASRADKISWTLYTLQVMPPSGPVVMIRRLYGLRPKALGNLHLDSASIWVSTVNLWWAARKASKVPLFGHETCKSCLGTFTLI